jgi:aspartyl-tRNA(Asn)/glutamyl-tRNA(Gln) amidotransferase subunit A
VIEMNANELTAHELAAQLRAREVSSREITQAVYDRIDAADEAVHAYVALTRDLAFEQADEVDRALAAGEDLPPLAGIPIALKDILCTKGIATTCCSRILENFVPPYDATVIEKVRAARMAWIGKTNMDEFAMGSSTENSAFGPTRNPWDLDRVPGGSSGGSAAAVAADEAVVAIGTDTGGSIRQPAALCGVVGMKPTYGRVSRYGLIAFASSLDQVGPITKDVTDAALLLDAIAGHDPLDSTSAPVEAPGFAAGLTGDVKGMRLGLVREFMEYEGVPVSAEVGEAVRRAVAALESLGASVEETSLPNLKYNIPVYYLIAPAECSSNLARYDGVAYGFRTDQPADDIVAMYRKTRDHGFGPEVKRRIMLGTYALSAGYYDAFYLKALQVRTLIKRDFDAAFETYDALIGPTSPSVAFRLGERTADPIEMYLSDVCTIPVNLAGLPGISLPCGAGEGPRPAEAPARRGEGGLPIGLQIVGKPFDEMTVLRAAHAFEQAAGFRRRALPAGGGRALAGLDA